MNAGAGTVHTIPARRAIALRIAAGDTLKVINTHGSQVIDTWAFVPADLSEHMSMEHSRLHMGRLSPRIGDHLVTNKRRPVLTLAEDTSGGVHDTLLAACDPERYHLLGYEGHHDNCTDNLRTALAEVGCSAPFTPSPLNLFENAPVEPSGDIGIEAPVCAPGGYVTLRAEMDVVVVFSACPQDMAPTNGTGIAPREAHVEHLKDSSR